MNWLDKLLGFDKLEESRLELQKSADAVVERQWLIHDLLIALHKLNDPRIEELFIKHEVTFHEKVD